MNNLLTGSLWKTVVEEISTGIRPKFMNYGQ